MDSDFPVWNAIGTLTPVRAPSVQFVERLVRGEPWLFIHNEISGQHVRVSELTRHIVQKFDGRQSVDVLVASVAGDADDNEKEAVATQLMTLSQLGMLNFGVDLSDQLIQQKAKHLLQHKKPPWSNPLAIRIPLLDPDRWLTRVNGRFGHWIGLRLLWTMVSVIVTGIALGLLNIGSIATELGVLASSPQQWWQIILIYPVLKCLHEFAHAIVIKRLQGSVHEAGLTLLVLMPVPYVDATDIWRFESRQQRMLVSSAGMLTEGFFAALALMIWLSVEPGFLADLTFAVALTGSITTLLFNANPLLKFDGYQVLQDALDIPNLASRSARYVIYLIKRYLLGASQVTSPVTGRGERAWLFCYALAAVGYRWIITLGIALYLATRFPVLGGMLALFALYKLSVTPCTSAIRYLLTAAEIQHRRVKAFLVSLCVVSLCLSIVFFMPVPTHTRAQGVVDVPSQAQLYAPRTGELAEIYVAPGDTVKPGQRILRIAAPELETHTKVVQSQLDVLEIEHQAALAGKPVLAASLRQDITEKQEILNRANKVMQSLVVHSRVAGRVSLAERFSRIGAYVGEGEALGHIVNDQDLLITAVVRESDIVRVEQGVHSVRIRLAERLSHSMSGSLSHVAPAATRKLPSTALAALGRRGGIAVASSGQHGWKTIEPVFHLEIELPADTRAVGIGGRAYVTLMHGSESIGLRSWQALRRLVLKELAL